MKKIVLIFSIIFGLSLNAQVVVLHPVNIPSDQVQKFLNVETNYSAKVAQEAVNSGDLAWWGLLRAFNAVAGEYNYMWVNVYKDIDAAVSSKSNWWNNSESVLGVKPDILLDGVNGAKADRRYFYQMR